MPTNAAPAIPLPAFGRQPIHDPELPEVTDDPTPTPQVSNTTTPHLQPAGDSPAPAPRPLPELSPVPLARSRTFSAGDASKAADVLAGLIVIAATIAGGWLRRRGLQLRTPTPAELKDITGPVGRIAARHLPVELIAPDLVDATEAAAAAHSYVMAGPLADRIAPISPEAPE